MAYFEIKSRNGSIVYSDDTVSLRLLAERYASDLNGVNLSQADLYGANLREAYLIRADLSHAGLSHANLDDAKLRYAELYGADLSHSSLVGADLSHVDLSWAMLIGADLRKANLSNASIYQANFVGADISTAFVTLRKRQVTVTPAIMALLATCTSFAQQRYAWGAVEKQPEILDAIQTIVDAGVELDKALPWLFL